MLRKKRLLYFPQDDDLDPLGIGDSSFQNTPCREASPTRLSVFIKPAALPAASPSQVKTPQVSALATLSPRNSEGKRPRVENDDALSPAPIMPPVALESGAETATMQDTVSEEAYVMNLGVQLSIAFLGKEIVSGGCLRLPRGDAETVRAVRLELDRVAAAVANYDRKVRLVDESLARPSAQTISSSSSQSSSSSSYTSEDSDDFDAASVRINSEGALKKLTIPRLKQVLRFHDLPISGNKQALISRLLEAGRKSLRRDDEINSEALSVDDGCDTAASSSHRSQDLQTEQPPIRSEVLANPQPDPQFSNGDEGHPVASVWEAGALFLRRSVETLFFQRRSSGMASDVSASRRHSW